MTDTVFIVAATGFASDLLGSASATAGVTVKRGDTLLLDAVFNDGVNPLELPADAAGVLTVKQVSAFAQTAILSAGSWAKQPSASGGYQFNLAISGSGLDGVLGNAPSVQLSGEITWTTGGVRTTTPTFNFTVGNNLTQ